MTIDFDSLSIEEISDYFREATNKAVQEKLFKKKTKEELNEYELYALEKLCKDFYPGLIIDNIFQYNSHEVKKNAEGKWVVSMVCTILGEEND